MVAGLTVCHHPFKKLRFFHGEGFGFRLNRIYSYRMLRSELVTRLAEERPHLPLKRVEQAVDVIFEEISAALERGDRVELRGFGAFSVRHRDARKGRNPRTGESVDVPAKKVPFFKAGKELRMRINNGTDPEAR